DLHLELHRVPLLAVHFGSAVHFLQCPLVTHARLQGQDETHRQVRPQLTLCPHDVPHAVFGHEDFQFPLASDVRQTEQQVAALHWAVDQEIANVPGDDLAGDG